MVSLTLYLLCALLSCAVTAGSLPLLRRTLGPYFADIPGGLKKHAGAVPAIGGCAVLLGLTAGLVFIRLTTDFPSGTLHSLRGFLIGAGLIFILGTADDLNKPKGVSISVKLFVQAAAVCVLMFYGVHISLVENTFLSYTLTFFWILGITNAFNLLDISDGLCVSQAFIAALGLWLITLPSEFIYVNFGTCTVLGACAGFWPYNHLKKYKSFLGDSGSTLLGFSIAALAVGTGYSQYTHLGFLAPLLILAVPLADTGFVIIMRLMKGKNPLQGSNDHAALRLLAKGYSRQRTLWTFAAVAVCGNLFAFIVTRAPATITVSIFLFAAVLFMAAVYFLSRIKMPL